jgi:hypothetical protein
MKLRVIASYRKKKMGAPIVEEVIVTQGKKIDIELKGKAGTDPARELLRIEPASPNCWVFAAANSATGASIRDRVTSKAGLEIAQYQNHSKIRIECMAFSEDTMNTITLSLER